MNIISKSQQEANVWLIINRQSVISTELVSLLNSSLAKRKTFLDLSSMISRSASQLIYEKFK